MPSSRDQRSDPELQTEAAPPVAVKSRKPSSPEERERRGRELYPRLLRAVAARKADASEYYAPSLRHGLGCPDRERSAAATGENPAEFRAHLCRFDRVFGKMLGFWHEAPSSVVRCPLSVAVNEGPVASASGHERRSTNHEPRTTERQSNRQSTIENRQSPDPLPVDASSPRAPKLTRALALILWLPLRLMRTQAIWELRALCYRLEELARWRRRFGTLTPARLNKFQADLDLLFSQHLDESRRRRRIRRRWQLVWEALFDPVAWEARLERWRRRAASRSSASDPADESATADSEARDDGTRQGLRRRGSNFDRNEPWMLRLNDLGPEPISDSSQSPGTVLRAVERRRKPVDVKPPSLWNYDAWRRRLQRSLTRADTRFRRAVRDVLGLRQPADAELRRLVKHGKLKVPRNFEEFEQLVTRAVGSSVVSAESPVVRGQLSVVRGQSSVAASASGAPESRPRKARREQGKIGSLQRRAPSAQRRTAKTESGLRATNNELRTPNSEPRTPNSEGRTPKAERRAPNDEPRTPNSELRTAAAVEHEFAEALWRRANFFSGRAVELQQLLAASLEWDTSRLPRLWRALLSARDAGQCTIAMDCHTDALARDRAARTGISVAEAWRLEEAETHPTPPWEFSPAGSKPSVAGEGQAARRVDSFRQTHEPRFPDPEFRNLVLDWQAAVDHADLDAVLRAHHATVTLYDLAVSRFGIRRDLLEWRPALSSAELETRQGRPEWRVRVVTTDGETWVKRSDNKIFQPEDQAAKFHAGVTA